MVFWLQLLINSTPLGELLFLYREFMGAKIFRFRASSGICYNDNDLCWRTGEQCVEKWDNLFSAIFWREITHPKDTVEGSPTTEVRKEGAWP